MQLSRLPFHGLGYRSSLSVKGFQGFSAKDHAGLSFLVFFFFSSLLHGVSLQIARHGIPRHGHRFSKGTNFRNRDYNHCMHSVEMATGILFLYLPKYSVCMLLVW